MMENHRLQHCICLLKPYSRNVEKADILMKFCSIVERMFKNCSMLALFILDWFIAILLHNVYGSFFRLIFH